MSVTICWRPTAGSTDIAGSSGDLQALEATFGSSPMRLNESAVRILRAMAKVDKFNKGDPYKALANAIDKHGEIEVFGET